MLCCRMRPVDVPVGGIELGDHVVAHVCTRLFRVGCARVFDLVDCARSRDGLVGGFCSCFCSQVDLHGAGQQLGVFCCVWLHCIRITAWRLCCWACLRSCCSCRLFFCCGSRIGSHAGFHCVLVDVSSPAGPFVWSSCHCHNCRFCCREPSGYFPVQPLQGHVTGYGQRRPTALRAGVRGARSLWGLPDRREAVGDARDRRT
mmetsp:Transcript_89338/g.239365  ORF Transcript_89338/g.239365 Transcript_89338/m.239365 type:complete len:202 (+) Transcript_89338:745-1350(+)